MLIVLCWLVCGFISSGIIHAYFSRAFVAQGEDGKVSLVVSLFGGPISLILFFFMTGFMRCGWKMPLTKLTKKEWDKYATSTDKVYFRSTRPIE